MIEPVESLSPRHRHWHRPQEDGDEIQIGYAKTAEDLQSAKPVVSVRRAGAFEEIVQDGIDTAAPGNESGEGAVFLQPAQSVAEALYGVDATAPANERKEGSVEDHQAEPIDPEVNIRQVQVSIASIQQVVPSGVDEGELEAIEKEEEEPLDPDDEAVLTRQALLDVVWSQRAASIGLLALAQSAESLQGATDQGSSRIPEPGEWLSSRYEVFPSESPAESSTASRPAYHTTPRRLEDREKPEARAEKARNWFAEWEKKKTNGATDGSPATGKDTWSASSLRSSRPPLVASSDLASCAPRMRIRSPEQIARESTANHRNSVVIDGWTYSTHRQEEDQAPSEPYGHADADIGLATIEDGAEDLQAAPTNGEEKDGSGNASTVGSAATSIWRGPAEWPDGRGGDGGEVRR